MLNRILETMNDCAFAFDQDKNEYVFISDCVKDITGYDSSDFKNDTGLFLKITDARDAERVKTSHQKFLHMPTIGRLLIASLLNKVVLNG